ncbi:hypothetical protein BJ944DRAFT_252168 [Cunninghamella echinulata]|nr:hypothetical protein BJ944DRAFT_252168 [Cunninghamella echinulata]
MAEPAKDEYDRFIECIGLEHYRFKESQYTLVYMTICLTCAVWQIITAFNLVWKSKKWLHLVVLFNVCLAFFVILCSVLNPLILLDCEFRYWVSIVCINIGGCCIQSILLYKAYICHNRPIWLLVLGSVINMGYFILIFLYATIGKVESHRDFIGNCVLNNLEWPALAKLGLDISSNLFLSFAFLSVIYRHYKVFGNSIHKSLFSDGLMFLIGVVTANIVTAILISCRAVGGLSADLYSFDWVITGYLLIKQFKLDDKKDQYDMDDEGMSQIRTTSSILSANISNLPSQPDHFHSITISEK